MLREKTTQKAHVPVGSSCDSGQTSQPVCYHSNDLRWDNRGETQKSDQSLEEFFPSSNCLGFFWLHSLKLKWLYLARCGSCNLRSPWMKPSFWRLYHLIIFGIHESCLGLGEIHSRLFNTIHYWFEHFFSKIILVNSCYFMLLLSINGSFFGFKLGKCHRCCPKSQRRERETWQKTSDFLIRILMDGF